MNDWWNDPPEGPPEPPECCGDMMEVDERGNCWCPNCGGFIAFRAEPEALLRDENMRMMEGL